MNQPIACSTFFLGLTLAANACVLQAQAAPPVKAAVTLPAGSDLRVMLDRDSRLHRVGQPVMATLTEAVYAGQTLVAAPGTRAEGHVIRIVSGPKGEHLSRFLRGDLTPVRVGEVAIDTLVLADGSRVLVATQPSRGLDGVHEVHFVPKGEKRGVKAQISTVLQPFNGPHKTERLTKALLQALPYHPNYLNAGAVYDAVLAHDVKLRVPSAPLLTASEIPVEGEHLLHLKLVSGLDSNSARLTEAVTAEVTQPFYNASHALLYPVGTRLGGQVTYTKTAGWLKKNGALSFDLASIHLPGQSTRPITATLVGLDIAGDQNITVSSEGDLRETNSRLKQGLALTGLVVPSLGLGDPSTIKTGLARVGAGESGFGLLGAGAAQATANVAVGFGYYGATKALYGAFLEKGKNVVLPANTPLSVRITSGADIPGADTAMAAMLN